MVCARRGSGCLDVLVTALTKHNRVKLAHGQGLVSVRLVVAASRQTVLVIALSLKGTRELHVLNARPGIFSTRQRTRANLIFNLLQLVPKARVQTARSAR